MADGTGRGINGTRYADPDLEATRAAITDAEITQAIGRARAVRRTAANPVQLHLLSDVVTNVPVAEMLHWRDVRPKPVDVMLATGIVLLDAAHAFRAFPGLWPSAEAARKAYQREEVRDIAYREIFYKKCPAPLARYCLAGPGQRSTEALVDLDLVPDPEAWLAQRLGQLACYELNDATGAAQPASAALMGIPTAVATESTPTLQTPPAPLVGTEAVPLLAPGAPQRVSAVVPIIGVSETLEIPTQTMPMLDLMDLTDIYGLGITEPVATGIFRVGNRPIIVHMDQRPYPAGDPRARDLALRIARALVPPRVGLGFGEPIFRELAPA